MRAPARVPVEPVVTARLQSWAYHSTSARDLRFDLLRGFAVVAMVVDHLAGPSPLYVLTGGNRFFTSAAEAFVLISGIVTGQVYGRMSRREDLGATLLRLLRRGWSLYLLTLGLTMIARSLGLAESGDSDGVTQRTPVGLLWSIVTLHQTAYLVDVPLLYTLLLLSAPVALLLMHQGRTWVVVLGSLALWGGQQLFAGAPDVPWPIAGNNLFEFGAWQVLFFAGMTLGYHREYLQTRISRQLERGLLLVSGVGFAALLLLFGVVQLSANGPALGPTLQEHGFAKSDLQIGRLVASGIVLAFFFLLATRFWLPLRACLGWLLLPLGQNALYAYTAHTAMALVVHSRFSVDEWPSSVNALAQLGGVALIWVAIRVRLLFPTGGTRRWLMLAPVPLAAVLLLVPTQYRLSTGPSQPAVVAAASDDAVRLARVFGTPIPRQQTPSRVPVSRESFSPRQSGMSSEAITLPPPMAKLIGARIQGSFRESTFHSAALDRQMSYYMYLPPDVDPSGARRYPVLYMLHGGSGSKDEWPAYGLIDAVDRLIAAGEIKPIIVVLPQGDSGYWVNQANNGPHWGDYVAQDVVMTVDRAAPTLADRDHRAVAGLSMGGAGALQLAFNHPDVFRVVGAHSPSLHLDDGTFPILGSGAAFAAREPLMLAAEAEGIDQLDIWIDAGDQDPWLERDEMLHQALVERGIVHQWSVLTGGHEGPYWQRNLETYLKAYDAALTDPARWAAGRGQ